MDSDGGYESGGGFESGGFETGGFGAGLESGGMSIATLEPPSTEGGFGMIGGMDAPDIAPPPAITMREILGLPELGNVTPLPHHMFMDFVIINPIQPEAVGEMEYVTTQGTDMEASHAQEPLAMDATVESTDTPAAEFERMIAAIETNEAIKTHAALLSAGYGRTEAATIVSSVIADKAPVILPNFEAHVMGTTVLEQYSHEASEPATGQESIVQPQVEEEPIRMENIGQAEFAAQSDNSQPTAIDESIVQWEEPDDPEIPVLDRLVNDNRLRLLRQTTERAMRTSKHSNVISGEDIAQRLPGNGELPAELTSGILEPAFTTESNYSDGSWRQLYHDLAQAHIPKDQRTYYAESLIRDHPAVTIDTSGIAASKDQVEEVLETEDSDRTLPW